MTRSPLKIWLIAPHAPETGVDRDINALTALFTARLHPDHRALPTNVEVVRSQAGTLVEADLRQALEAIDRWHGPRVVWLGGHGEIRGLDVPFFRTDDRHGGYVTVDSIWARLDAIATRGKPLIVLFDACHAAPSEALRRHLGANLVAIAATHAGETTEGSPDTGGWLTRAFVDAMTTPASRRDDGVITVAGLIAELWSARTRDGKGGQVPFVHQGQLGDRALNTVGPVEVDAIAAWRAFTRLEHRNLVPFFRRGGDRLLDEVYVELCLDRERGDGKSDGNPDGVDGIRMPRSLSLRDLMASKGGRGRWLVLGEPGAGKSTIARHLAATLAAEGGTVPIYLPLAKLAATGQHPFARARSMLVDEGEEAGAELVQALRRREKQPGHIWLLLDGLDEVAEDDRAALLDRLRRWSERMPDVAIAVFGRPFRHVDLPGFDRATVRPLDPGQQRRLLAGWLNETEAPLTARTIASHPRLAQLARNPLLLSLMALLTREGQGLPPTRSALYAEAVTLLMGQPQTYGRAGRLAHPAAARRLLGAISATLHHASVEAWDAPAVLAAVRAAVIDDALAADLAAYGSPEALLAELTRCGGVFGPFDGEKGRWRYLHRSLREFLAAEHLTARPSRLQALLAELRATRNPDDWGVVLGLACARAPDKAAALELVQAASPGLALWALPEVELAPAAGLAFFDRLVGDADPAKHGEDLRRLAVSWGPKPATAEALLAGVGPETPVERLAVVHYALCAAGVAVDAAAFFRRAGRPMPAQAELVHIRGGSFVMGSPDSEQGHYDREAQHRVTVSSFELGATAVTRAEYADLDPAHECPGSDVHPVTELSWYEARLYAAWRGAALPTEAEWEFACRAGTTTRFWSGDGEDDLARVGWLRGSEQADYQVQAVGRKPANPLGLYDMHGNTYEWCADWYGTYEPADTLDPSGPPDGWDRVARGGDGLNRVLHCRSAFRRGWSPGRRVDDLGFRLARRPPST